MACHQEGERKLTDILDGLNSGEWTNTPGISFLKNNSFFTNKDIPRIRDLTQIPSAYLKELSIN